MLGRKVRFNLEQIREGAALLVGELAAEAVRVQHRLTLRGRHLPQIAEGVGHQSPAVLGKRSKLLHRPANLLPLRHAEMFHRLVALDQALALLGRHIVELSEAIAQMLLCLRGKLAEARLVFERPLLLGQRETAVVVHPLFKMFLPLRVLPGTPLILPRPPLIWARARLVFRRPGRSPGRPAKRGRSDSQHQRHKRRLESPSEFKWKEHGGGQGT